MNKEEHPIDENIAQVKTLFKPGSWFAKIDFINHLILFNNVIINVLSEKEGGKTSFSALLQNNLDSQIKFHATTVHPGCTLKEVIYELAQGFNLTDPNPKMASLVAHINEGKSHMLLILDDAHHLPDDFIKEALEVIEKQDDFGFFHLCFISDHSIAPRFNQLSTHPLNDLIHTIELSSLNENETRTYVLQRLMKNQAIKKVPSELQFKQFYQLTKGNMSKINHKLDGFIANCAKTAKIKKIHWVQCAGVLISAVFVLKATFWHFSRQPVAETQANGNTSTKKNIRLSSVLPEIKMPFGGSKLLPFEISSWLKPEILVSQIPSWQEGAKNLDLIPFELPNNQLGELLEENSKNTTIALVDKVIVIPKIIKLNTQKAAINEYTIQLLASHNIKDLQAIKQNNPLLAKTQIRYFRNEKGLWYILILGQYKNKTDAQSHAKNLPLELAKLNPWVRPISGLEQVG